MIGLYLNNNDTKLAKAEINKILNIFPYSEERKLIYYETSLDYIKYNYYTDKVNVKTLVKSF